MFDLKNVNLNWSALWRKALAGGLFAALMGYTYKANQKFDERVDAKYPDPRNDKTDKTEEADPAS